MPYFIDTAFLLIDLRELFSYHKPYHKGLIYVLYQGGKGLSLGNTGSSMLNIMLMDRDFF